MLKNRNAAIELYDLTNDVQEKENVASAHPDVVKQIQQFMLQSHTESLVFPWGN